MIEPSRHESRLGCGLVPVQSLSENILIILFQKIIFFFANRSMEREIRERERERKEELAHSHKQNCLFDFVK